MFLLLDSVFRRDNIDKMECCISAARGDKEDAAVLHTSVCLVMASSMSSFKLKVMFLREVLLPLDLVSESRMEVRLFLYT